MKIALLMIALSLFTLGCISPSYSWNSEQSPAQKKLAEKLGFDHMEVGCNKYGVSITGYFFQHNVEPVSRYFDNRNDVWNGLKVWDTFCEPFRPPDF